MARDSAIKNESKVTSAETTVYKYHYGKWIRVGTLESESTKQELEPKKNPKD